MSIILKGIDLPDEKLMEIFESDNHIYIGGHYYPLMIKDVVQIPKGHGTIKDTDEIIALFRRVTTINKSIMIDAIQQTDTILEAEEG